MKKLKLSSIFLILFIVLSGCAGDSDDNDDRNTNTSGEETPTPDPDPNPEPDPDQAPGDEITLEASIDFSDGTDGRVEGEYATVDGEYDVMFTGTIRIPVKIDVVDGNSGVGWTGITVGERKFCYKGNASDTQTPDGDAYELMNEAITLDLPCVPVGFDNPDPVVEVTPESDLKLHIEIPGCAFGQGACLDTNIEAKVEVESNDG